jgi:hypothetical protein
MVCSTGNGAVRLSSSIISSVGGGGDDDDTGISSGIGASAASITSKPVIV